jgi:hypothetical protein
MRALPHILLAIFLVVLSACDLDKDIPKPVSLSDPKIAPMLAAIAAVDRSSLGFTPITANADILLETPVHSGPHSAYDAMLHIYGVTSRTIAFRKIPDGYRWIAEQETYTGPRQYRTVDGDFSEQIVVDYQVEPLDGVPVNRINITYYGEDPRFVRAVGPDTAQVRDGLIWAIIKPVLDEWNAVKPK